VEVLSERDRSDGAEELAAGALDWLLKSARETETGWVWADTGGESDPTLYSGAAGIVLALLEAHQHFGDDRYGHAALRGARALTATVDQREDCSLYFGLTGTAVALHAVGERLNDAATAAAVAGDTELALLAVTPYLHTAEAAAGGVNWQVQADSPARVHHISHGTLGIAYALAAVGHATGRSDLMELAVTADPTWSDLADRCWHTVIHSGLPQQLRPGFWDNNGRCCGTAGVLALACDRIAEQDDEPAFARTLVEDLARRATIDTDGVRWSNHEHRATPSTLTARTG
jgi:Lanthionine synthetase C-like protein